jgi:hypothetical protein
MLFPLPGNATFLLFSAGDAPQVSLKWSERARVFPKEQRMLNEQQSGAKYLEDYSSKILNTIWQLKKEGYADGDTEDLCYEFDPFSSANS